MKNRIVMFGAISIGSVFFFSCKNEKTRQIPELEKLRTSEPVSESFNVLYRYSEQTELRTVLRAPHAVEKMKDNQSILIFDQGVMIQFYDSEGKPESQLTARRAELYRNSGFAEATGKVVVRNNRDEVLETERLCWHKTRKIISTNAFVKITTPKDIFLGDSLTANTSFTRYKIYKLKGQFKVDENKEN